MSLRSAFHFTSSDLEANRRGEITEKQRSRLRLRMYGMFALALVGALWIAWVGCNNFSWPTSPTPLDIILPAIMILLFLGICWWLRAEFQKWRQDIARGRVIPACGCARFDIRRRKWVVVEAEWFGDEEKLLYYFTHTLTIGPQRFDLAPHQLHTFTEGEAYCVYYTPKTRCILSAEGPLTDNHSKNATG